MWTICIKKEDECPTDGHTADLTFLMWIWIWRQTPNSEHPPLYSSHSTRQWQNSCYILTPVSKAFTAKKKCKFTAAQRTTFVSAGEDGCARSLAAARVIVSSHTLIFCKVSQPKFNWTEFIKSTLKKAWSTLRMTVMQRRLYSIQWLQTPRKRVFFRFVCLFALFYLPT